MNIFLWLIVAFALGVGALPVFRAALLNGTALREPETAQRKLAALALALACGPALFAGVMWFAGWFFKLPLENFIVRAGALVLVLASVPYLRGAFPLWQDSSKVFSGMLSVFAVALLVRAYQPEIFWGEKPMDFTFLNYFVREVALPPQEPWAAGHTLSYYYFGFFLFGLLHKITGVSSAFGFNFALASISAWLFCAVFGLCLLCMRSQRGALWSAVVIIAASNVEWVRLKYFLHMPFGFDLFWATSRLITSPVISEYPVWSQIFGDLHPHLMAMPVSAAAIALQLTFLREVPKTNTRAIVLGLLMGLLAALNAWDFITQVGFLALILAAVILRGSWETIGNFFWQLAATACSCAVVLGPWVLALGPGPEFHAGWAVEDFSLWHQLARHLGHFLLPILFALLLLRSPGRKVSLRLFLAVLLAANVPLMLGAILKYILFVSHVPWDILLPCAVLAGWAALWVMAPTPGESVHADHRVVSFGVLVLAGAMVIAFCETIFIMDHTNTMFKFYLPLWIWLGVAAAIAGELLYELRFEHAGSAVRSIVSPKVAGSWAMLSLVAFPVVVGLLGTVVSLYGLKPFQRVEGPRPTLNGLAYLPFSPQSSPDEAAAFEFLRDQIPGTPVMLEAWGPSYREFTRVSMYTGLPTVLGWDYHIQQRGVSRDEVDRRRDAVAQLYSSGDVEKTKDLLRQYRVDYVFVGMVERRMYGEREYDPAGYEKFAQHPELFKPIYRRGGVVVYQVIGL